ncbi:MAG TPA: O-antigen ligase family protein [Chthoniobacterales bacterium]
MVAVITRASPHAGINPEGVGSSWRRVNIGLVAGLVVAALLTNQVLIGGTRLLFAFPSYGLLALAGLLGLLAIRGTKSLPDPICLASTVAFLGYILVRAGFSPVHYIARFDTYSVMAALIVYFLTAMVLTEARLRLLILACLLAAGLAHVIVGALQFRNGDNWMPISFLQRFDYGHRASGFYICPNHLAGLLEVLGVFGLSITFWSRLPVWAKLLTGYVTMACYIGVVLTASRGGYLSVITSLLVFAGLSLRIAGATPPGLRLRLIVGVSVLGALAAGTIFLVIHKSDYLSDRTGQIVDNKNIRLDLWRAALQQWHLSPWIGTGSGTYLFYGRQFRTDAVLVDPVYTHNDYLQLLAEYGLAGGAAFLPFLLLHLRRGLITARKIGPRRIAASHRLLSNAMALNLGAFAAVAAYCTHSVFDFNLHIPANALLLAFAFGILANSGVDPGSHGEKRRWGMFLGGGILLAVSAGLGAQTVRLMPGEFYSEQARTALRDHRPLPALASALHGLEFERENPHLYYYLGRARVLAGEQQTDARARASFQLAALPAYESALALAPADETYWLELAFTLDSLERFPEGEWMFYQARQLDPRSPAIRQYYEAHLNQWRGEKASSEIERPDPHS